MNKQIFENDISIHEIDDPNDLEEGIALLIKASVHVYYSQKISNYAMNEAQFDIHAESIFHAKRMLMDSIYGDVMTSSNRLQCLMRTLIPLVPLEDSRSALISEILAELKKLRLIGKVIDPHSKVNK